MTKDVLISIEGFQMLDSDQDQLSYLTPGTYYYRNGKHYLMYQEAVEGFQEPCQNRIKFCQESMEYTKQGPNASHMVFEPDKKNTTYYNTPFGSIQLATDQCRISIEEQEELLEVRVSYCLEMNGEAVSENTVHLKVRPKGSEAFKLMEK